jgi:hypothetical protein
MEGNMRARGGSAVRSSLVSGIDARFPVGNWPDPL